MLSEPLHLTDDMSCLVVKMGHAELGRYLWGADLQGQSCRHMLKALGTDRFTSTLVSLYACQVVKRQRRHACMALAKSMQVRKNFTCRPSFSSCIKRVFRQKWNFAANALEGQLRRTKLQAQKQPSAHTSAHVSAFVCQQLRDGSG